MEVQNNHKKEEEEVEEEKRRQHSKQNQGENEIRGVKKLVKKTDYNTPNRGKERWEFTVIIGEKSRLAVKICKRGEKKKRQHQ